MKQALNFSINIDGQQFANFAQVYSRQCAFRHYAEKLLHYTTRKGYFTLSDSYLAQKWEVSISTVRNVIRKLQQMGLVKLFHKVRLRDPRNPLGWFCQRVIVFAKETVRVKYPTQQAQAGYERFEQEVLQMEQAAKVQVQQLPKREAEERTEVVREFMRDPEPLTQEQVEQATKQVKEAGSDGLPALMRRSPAMLSLLLKLACHLQHTNRWDVLQDDRLASTFIGGVAHYQAHLHLDPLLVPYMKQLARLDRETHALPTVPADLKAYVEQLLG